jgi:hypothetical protein
LSLSVSLPVYDAVDSSSYGSRYILYNDTTFTLEYSRAGDRTFEYRGRYARAESQIVFNFGFFGPTGPWQAIGAMGGNSGNKMDVTYNELMRFVAFVNGTYVRASGPG